MPITAVVEMPKGTRYKYEFSSYGDLTLDRVISIPIPSNYGFIPGTLAQDGDPLDVFIVTHGQLIPGTEVQIEPIGGFFCNDSGKQDDKILAVIVGEGISDTTKDHVLNDINYFLVNYKKDFQVLGSCTVDEAKDIIQSSYVR